MWPFKKPPQRADKDTEEREMLRDEQDQLEQKILSLEKRLSVIKRDFHHGNS